MKILNSQADLYNSQLTKSANTYEEFTQDFIEGLTNSNYEKLPDSITDDVILEWLANPDENLEEIIAYMTYLYYSDGNVYQLYTLMRDLPKLNYKIRAFEKVSGYEETLVGCDKLLYQVNYKKTTRDLLSQLAATGNVVGIWLGSKSNIYLHVFPADEYVFAGYRMNNEWVVHLDMAKFEDMKDIERNIQFEMFKSIGLAKYYKKYLNNKDKFKYMILPQDRTFVLRANTLYDSQMKGMPMGTQSLFDLSHKSTLRKLDKSIVEKAIKGINVLKIGDDTHEFDAINKGLKQKIIKSVQTAIINAQKSKGLGGLAILPNFADLNFSEMNGLDALNDNKFNNIDESINSSIGVASAITGGSSGNFSSSKINLDVLHRRISAMLEEIEIVFRKLFEIVLTKQLASNISFEFVKTNLTDKEELEVLIKLNQQGFSAKSVVDQLTNINYTELINDSLYEIETLKLRDKIIPPKTSSTLSSDDEIGGNKEVDNPENANTEASKSSGGNLTPDA